MVIAFYSSGEHVGLWDHVREAFGRPDIYEIGGDPDNANPSRGWYAATTIDDVPGAPIDRVFFSPPDAATMPGITSLGDYDHEQSVYIFGHDDRDNGPISCECVVYIDTPISQALYAVQAAGIVLHDKHHRGL